VTAPDSLRWLDPNNRLLAGGPVTLECGTVAKPGEPLVVGVTMRTDSATVTGFITPAQLNEWADYLAQACAALDGSPRLEAATMADLARLDPTISGSVKPLH
jgi:hypothetical protein